eukprot:scaffold34409_cov112-Isochrysis_galbana.AAC.2
MRVRPHHLIRSDADGGRAGDAGARRTDGPEERQPVARHRPSLRVVQHLDGLYFGRPALHLAPPLEQHGGWADDQAGPPPARGLEAGPERDHLQRLAQPHLVAQDAPHLLLPARHRQPRHQLLPVVRRLLLPQLLLARLRAGPTDTRPLIARRITLRHTALPVFFCPRVALPSSVLSRAARRAPLARRLSHPSRAGWPLPRQAGAARNAIARGTCSGRRQLAGVPARTRLDQPASVPGGVAFEQAPLCDGKPLAPLRRQRARQRLVAQSGCPTLGLRHSVGALTDEIDDLALVVHDNLALAQAVLLVVLAVLGVRPIGPSHSRAAGRHAHCHAEVEGARDGPKWTAKLPRNGEQGAGGGGLRARLHALTHPTSQKEATIECPAACVHPAEVRICSHAYSQAGLALKHIFGQLLSVVLRCPHTLHMAHGAISRTRFVFRPDGRTLAACDGAATRGRPERARWDFRALLAPGGLSGCTVWAARVPPRPLPILPSPRPLLPDFK